MVDLSRFHRAAARHAGRTVSFRSPLDEATNVEVLQVRTPTVSQLDAELAGYSHHLDIRTVDLPELEPGWLLVLDGTDYEVLDAERIGPDDAITRCYLEARGEQIA